MKHAFVIQTLKRTEQEQEGCATVFVMNAIERASAVFTPGVRRM